MGITSFSFLCFYGGLLVLYYLVPKKMQWGLLLAASVGYFVLSGEPWLILYPAVTVMIVYAGALYIDRAEEQKKKRMALSLVIISCVFLLCLLKYLHLGLLAPIGISFYTLTLLGYVLEVYYEMGKAERNLGKVALFGYYFPTLISGPIVRYGEMKEQLFEGHSFEYHNITYGLQRMVWGFFKKLVISERMALVVNTVFNSYGEYSGMEVVLAAVCFTFQLYTDFSGCMDIVLGVSQTFAIKLPENFKTPFFSTNISEYWRRWHITLGSWLKDFLFYPLLRTSFFMKLPGILKKRMNKKRAKQINVFLAMFLLWFVIGFWHGGAWKYIIGSGVLHWFYIVSGELLEPVWQRLRGIFRVSGENRGFVMFQRVRTFALVTIGLTFFRADNSMVAAGMLKSMVTTWNPQVLWNGTLFTLGLDRVEFVIGLVSLLILLLVSCLEQKGSVRDMLAGKSIWIRWAVLYALIFYVILLGYYGPGYSAAEFIYQGF